MTVVLSSDLGPYVEAYKGFQDAFGAPVRQINLKTDIFDPSNISDVVVAFGGKAALETYPDDTVVIYCLAPGVQLKVEGQQTVKIPMLPSAADVLNRLKILQPNLRRLATIWASDAQADYLQELAIFAKQVDIVLISERISDSDDLPGRLRKVLQEGVDGVWLPPDPALINARSFSVFREFSWSNNVPLYVPTAGLVDKGAVAAVSSGFWDIGRTAGEVAKRALQDNLNASVIYPLKVELRVNLDAADQAGLELNQEDLIEKGAVLQ
ncbi:MAG: ABC transporter substrate binding protein [Candidatus Latescibacteria bacterium]|nr:ABC transporter substrate binding protein [Candidatus Latescibacterota bacterium]